MIIKLIPCLDKYDFQDPAVASQSAFDYAFGASFFDWMKGNLATLRCFDSYMAGRRVGKASWLDYYPIEERLVEGTSLENEIFMVDIGGGQGHDLKSLSDKYSNNGLPGRLILQDLVADTREDSSTTFEIMVHDFFEPQPVKGAPPHDRPRTSPVPEVDGKVLSLLPIADCERQSRRPGLSYVFSELISPLLDSVLRLETCF